MSGDKNFYAHVWEALKSPLKTVKTQEGLYVRDWDWQ